MAAPEIVAVFNVNLIQDARANIFSKRPMDRVVVLLSIREGYLVRLSSASTEVEMIPEVSSRSKEVPRVQAAERLTAISLRNMIWSSTCAGDKESMSGGKALFRSAMYFLLCSASWSASSEWTLEDGDGVGEDFDEGVGEDFGEGVVDGVVDGVDERVGEGVVESVDEGDGVGEDVGEGVVESDDEGEGVGEYVGEGDNNGAGEGVGEGDDNGTGDGETTQDELSGVKDVPLTHVEHVLDEEQTLQFRGHELHAPRAPLLPSGALDTNEPAGHAASHELLFDLLVKKCMPNLHAMHWPQHPKSALAAYWEG